MTHKPKILMVDDDPDFTEAVSSYLEANGYLMLKASNGSEGLKLAKTERPDLVLIDVIMRERTEGFFTVQEMRRTSELAGVPIFVLSSVYSQIPEFRIAPEAGWLAHDEFLSKPVNLTELLDKIRNALAESAAKETRL